MVIYDVVTTEALVVLALADSFPELRVPLTVMGVLLFVAGQCELRQRVASTGENDTNVVPVDTVQRW